MSAPTLKPCPFCGGKAQMMKGHQAFEDCEIHCKSCAMVGPNFGAMGETFSPEEDAALHWNTRAALPAIQEAKPCT